MQGLHEEIAHVHRVAVGAVQAAQLGVRSEAAAGSVDRIELCTHARDRIRAHDGIGRQNAHSCAERGEIGGEGQDLSQLRAAGYHPTACASVSAATEEPLIWGQKLTGCGVLVSLGGDLSIAGEPPAGGWLVGVAEDHAAPPSTVREQLHLTSGGLATSSTTVRRWIRGHEQMHHILDPATGLPARVHWRTATVGAATCLDANIAATAAIVMGSAAARWLEVRGLPARLVGRDGRIQRVGAWPAQAEMRRQR